MQVNQALHELNLLQSFSTSGCSELIHFKIEFFGPDIDKLFEIFDYLFFDLLTLIEVGLAPCRGSRHQKGDDKNKREN